MSNRAALLESLIKRSRGVSPVPPAPSIPTDYVFLHTLKDGPSLTAETGQTMTLSGSNATQTTLGGVSCTAWTGSTRLYTTETTGLPSGAHPFTESVWVYRPSSNSADQTWFMMGTSGNGTNQYEAHLKQYNNYAMGGFWYGDVEPIIAVPTGTWTHYLQTYDGTTCVLYQDGVQTGSRTIAGNITYGQISIGGATHNSIYLTGGAGLRNVLIYDRVLTSSEITDIYSAGPSFAPIPTDYVFYARLKDSFTPETGTLDSVAGRWSISTAPDGVPAACNTDTSQGDFTMAGMRFVPAAALQGNTNLTCSAWIYGTRELNVQPPDQLAVIGAGRRNGYGVLLEYRSSGSSEFPWNSMSVSDTTVRPSNGEWHNVLFTYERGVSTKVYVDGALSIDYTPGASVTIDTNYIYVGGRYDDGRPWVGYMREAMVWTRVLTSSEITAIYNAGLE